MSTVYITEYAGILGGRGESIQAPSGMQAKQTVAIGVSSTQSNAFKSATRLIRIHTDAVCSFVIGSDPTATATDARLPADGTEFHSVRGGEKIAIITNS